MGMSEYIHFASQFENLWKASGMIVVSMTQEDLLDAPQISVQGKAIRDHRMPIARIEEEIALVGLNKSRESMFPRANAFPDGVFTKYRYPCSHPLVSFEPKF